MILPQNLGLGLLRHRGAADSDLDMIQSGDLQLLLPRHVEAFGLTVLEYRVPVANVRKDLAVAGDVAVALQHDKRHFPVLGVEGQLLSGIQLNNAEFQLLQAALTDLAELGVALGGNIRLLVIHRSSSFSNESTISSQSPTMP